jgi:hypothetical protein
MFATKQRLSIALLAGLTGAATAACSEPGIDTSHAECWPGEGGAFADDKPLRLGAGETFEAFDDGGALYLEHGIQGGYHVFLNLRVEGINPGDPSSEEPEVVNPQTRFAMYFDDGERIDLERCPLRRALSPLDANGYSLEGGQSVVVQSLFVVNDACDNPRLVHNGEFVDEVRVVVEIMDCDGLHAYGEALARVPKPTDPRCYPEHKYFTDE